MDQEVCLGGLPGAAQRRSSLGGPHGAHPLLVSRGRPTVPADDGDDQAGDDQADDDQADDEQGDDQHPLDDWPNYIIKAAKRRCKRYLDKAMRPLNWVVQPEARRASRSSRTAVGSPEYHQMIRQTEGRGKEYEPRIESAFGFRFLEQRDQQILVMHQDGYSQADIAKNSSWPRQRSAD